ncbi:CAP domain-containing protein [Paracoccus seriniphilus]|uniref:Cysteine-rich secretory protein family protein n=1 Tax=Paracoccus seriniphilus TaxID=184748 RepID=A0A239PR73_9RHOB|nr:CAP domain-containing protein [Paracoccus seriniphilus]SNT72804.1 Cysteine-rich secretory protein family protein [Paracoccus seriniphilus]
MKYGTLFASILGVALLTACDMGGSVTDETEILMEDAPTAKPTSQSLASSCSGDPAMQQQMMDAVNAARASAGKSVLDVDPKLVEIAQAHACDMAATGRATVAGSDGSNIVDRARAVGYDTCGVAQLVAVGRSPEGILAGWQRSLPHREELFSQMSTEQGAGVVRGADGRLWWSVVLAEDCR